LENYDKGIPYIEKVHNIKKDNTWSASYLGNIDITIKNDKVKAGYWYEEALKRAPNDANIKAKLEKLNQ
jgi:hypothetical protein